MIIIKDMYFNNWNLMLLNSNRAHNIFFNPVHGLKQILVTPTTDHWGKTDSRMRTASQGKCFR